MVSKNKATESRFIQVAQTQKFHLHFDKNLLAHFQSN